ncbi:MAG: 23S rRNA (adenine(2503)-C(2))-methyltransferase RlmN [Syntrophales bacterium]
MSEAAKKEKTNLKDMTLSEMEEFISGLGKERYRAGQIMKWLYRHYAVSIEEMTNLSKDFRSALGELARISAIHVDALQTSRDRTRKILFRLEDGNHIESVLIPGKNHWTLCVSTQAGCRMYCRFCLTGRCGFKRDLLPSEITDQITVLRRQMPDYNIGNIVMMGMGEPLDNYANVLKALEIMSLDIGLSFSGRRVTVSTCGIPPMIRRLGREANVNLAVSLNAADNRTRSFLMPINKKYPIEEIIHACREYEMPRRRRITFEYILIEGVNASVQDAEKLARLLRGVRCKINLIAYNEHPGSGFKTPSRETIDGFRNVLVHHKYTTVLRASRGADILAACGQLGSALGLPG